MVSTSGNQKGGGYGSRQHTEVKVRTGSGARSASVGGVGQIGASQGRHLTNRDDSNYRGEPLHAGRSFNPVKYGNEIALNSKSAPGQGRTIYKTGSQGTQGSVNPGAPGLPSTRGQWPDTNRNR
jgi:hypothetical protein